MIFVNDNFNDVAGTLITAHTPIAGGPIVANFGVASITNANRVRGAGVIGGSFHYTAQPINKNWGLEFTLYIASYDGGFDVLIAGYVLSHIVGNGFWSLTGGQLPSPLRSNQIDFQPGETHYGRLISQNGVLTFWMDSYQQIQGADSSQPAIAPPGCEFFEADTDNTGYQLASFSAYNLQLQNCKVVSSKGAIFGPSSNE